MFLGVLKSSSSISFMRVFFYPFLGFLPSFILGVLGCESGNWATSPSSSRTWFFLLERGERMRRGSRKGQKRGSGKIEQQKEKAIDREVGPLKLKSPSS